MSKTEIQWSLDRIASNIAKIEEENLKTEYWIGFKAALNLCKSILEEKLIE